MFPFVLQIPMLKFAFNLYMSITFFIILLFLVIFLDWHWKEEDEEEVKENEDLLYFEA